MWTKAFEPPFTPNRFAQIDYISTTDHWKNTIKNVIATDRLAIDSDHKLIKADIRVKLAAKKCKKTREIEKVL